MPRRLECYRRAQSSLSPPSARSSGSGIARPKSRQPKKAATTHRCSRSSSRGCARCSPHGGRSSDEDLESAPKSAVESSTRGSVRLANTALSREEASLDVGDGRGNEVRRAPDAAAALVVSREESGTALLPSDLMVRRII